MPPSSSDLFGFLARGVGMGAMLLALGGLSGWGAPVQAQSATEQQILFQLNQMQTDLRALQSQVYGGGAGTGGAVSGNVAADVQVRLGQLQRDLQSVTGQLEQLSHQIRQIGDRVERLSTDVEYRFQALEGGGGATQQQGAAPAPASSSSQIVAGEEPRSLGTVGSSASTAAANFDLPGTSAQDSYQHAFGLMRQSRFDQAEVALKAFLVQYPNDPLAGNAQYWLGETFYARGDYSQAAVAFAEGYQKYPSSRKAPDNVLKLAKSLAQLGRIADACAALIELPRQLPNAPPQTLQKAAEERQRLGCS